jgi:chromate reductase
MKLLVIGGSNSKNSINRKFAQFAASLFDNTIPELVDISQLDIPLFSVDREAEKGIPQAALDFANQIDNADMILLSLAENNGSYNVGFKNLMDWTSRIKDRKTWGNKAMLLLSTSPGARGGATVLEAAKKLLSIHGSQY